MKEGLLAAALLALVAAGVWWASMRTPHTAVATAGVEVGPMTAWTTYEGELDARRTMTILSRFEGNATIVELVRDGTPVEEGAVVARLSSSQVEQDLVRLERDLALAEAELTSLEKARLPIELRELELKTAAARAACDTERQYLADIRQLMDEQLVSAEEVRQQEHKVAQLEEQFKSLEFIRDLTGSELHPAALQKARASQAAAERALRFSRQQLANCTIRAPGAGVISLKPLYIGTEFRTVRVGDVIYPNQPFMVIPDMREVVVRCHIPEAELARVQTGMSVVITPVAYTELRLPGQVETVASVARAVPERPAWQKYFEMTVSLTGGDGRLRAGMSTHVNVLSYQAEDILLVPRAAVAWRSDAPFCNVLTDGGVRETRRLELGKANPTHFEVLSGLARGEHVVLEE